MPTKNTIVKTAEAPVKNLETLHEKIAVITGASSGIGYYLAELFAQNGYNTILVARNEKKLLELKVDFEKRFGMYTHILAADLSNPSDVAIVCGFLKGKHIDVLVNNAGFGDYGAFSESDWKRQSDMIQVNIVALTALTHSVLADMTYRKHGRILNVASTAAFQPGPFMSVYFASKSYVLSFTEAIAQEVKNTGVTVTALCPGPTQSNFASASLASDNPMFQSKKIATAAQVAQFGYDALMAGQIVAVHGLTNKVLVQSLRLLPRSIIRRIIESMQKKK